MSEPVAGPSRFPYRKPRIPPATQPEIIRASQKDLYYLHLLSEQIDHAARSILGQRWLQRWTKELALTSKLLYFSLTTFAGSQTLGEEYTDILQISGARVPKRKHRFLFLLAHVIAPYAFGLGYATFRRRLLQLQDHHQALEEVMTDKEELANQTSYLQKILLKLYLPTFEDLVEQHIRPLHLAIFFLTGKYYSVAKRCLRIKYLSTQPPIDNGMQPPSYEVLGAMMGVQLVIRLALGLQRWRKQIKETREREAKKQVPTDEKTSAEVKRRPLIDSKSLHTMTFDPENPTPVAEISPADDEDYDESLDSFIPQEKRCTLCLGARRDATSTSCGHIFCWECIVGWAREKAECPLCRQTVGLSQLIPLYNI